MESPKVFISYSHDTKEHSEWVSNLATHLRSHGVDIILDQWDLRIGDDLPFFMENGLSYSKLLICICSEDYVIKSNSSTGGVGYEKNIIVQPLLKNSSINHIIPLIRNNNSDNQDLIEKPPLGNNPFEFNQTHKIIGKLNIESIKYHNPHNYGKVIFNYENNSGNFKIGSGKKSFLTSWSSCGNRSIYAYKDNVKLMGYNKEYNEFPSTDNILDDYDFSSRSRCINEDNIVIWINSENYIATTKLISISNKDRGDRKSEIKFEYKIYENIIDII